MSQPTAYKLRVVISGVSPLIWRRLLVSSDIDLDQLHDILQINFDWSDRYFHCFRIHGVEYRYGNSEKRLLDFRLRRRECFRYEYYPLTSWKLDIRLEDILPVDLKRPKPICVGGQRAGPPEDGLGAWQYLERLDNHKYSFPYEEFGLMARAVQQVLESGTREGLNLDELREAMCRVEDYQQFRPDHFDRREVNRQLQSSAEEGERV